MPVRSVTDDGGADPFEHRAVVLEGQGLSRVYRMGEVEVRALQDVDVALRQGELVAILGASGSGKSTLLNILGGLDVPSSGRVVYRGTPLASSEDHDLTLYRRRHVGFVFQFFNLIPSLTALENVELVTDVADNPMEAGDALALVGLADRMDHFPAQLSGGEQQRVAIARAVAKRPDILLCDEPTGALDFKTGKLVLHVLDDVNRQLGTTTAIITHNVAMAGLAHRVITMMDGRIKHTVHNAVQAAVDELQW